MRDPIANKGPDGGISRRELIRRGALFGTVAPALGALLSACIGAPQAQPSGPQGSTLGSAPTVDGPNPLGVRDGTPLDAVIFKGGFGDEYAINAEAIYKQLYPAAQISHQGIQRLGEQLQPRFVAGNPPDVIENSGAGSLDTAALAAGGQLADLSDLLEAPSFDVRGMRVMDTLIPGSQLTGAYAGRQHVLHYAYTVRGVWYNDALLQEKGWRYPHTWDDMLLLCEQIKSTGVAPWTYQGRFPQYMLYLLDSFVYKHGGLDAIKAIDNLQPDAWLTPPVRDSVEALYQLAARDYIMPGTAGLTHTEAQAEWLQGKAVFLPCGSWLENEMKALIPENFRMVMAPSPSLAGDKVRYEGVNAYAAMHFLVPAQAKNVQGGKELLRIIFSKQAGRFFSQVTGSLSTVMGAAEGLDLGPAFASVQQAVNAAGNDTFLALYHTWYRRLEDDAKDQMGALLTKQVAPEEFLTRTQAAADAVARDGSIQKYTRS